MFELILAVLFSTLIIVTFRLMAKFGINELQAIVWNYFFATALGLLVWQQSLTLTIFTESSWFLPAVGIGVFFIITFFLLSRSAVKAGVAITAVSSRMSVVIPVIAGFVIFHETITVTKVVGILIVLISFYLIFKPKGNVQINFKDALLPFLLFLGIGINDTLMKYIQFHYLDGDESLFLTVVFMVAFIIGGLLLLKKLAFDKEKLSGKALFVGLILGMFNFGTTYFFIRSMSFFEASILFPVFNVSIVALTAIIGVALFNEKLSRVNWAGIFMAILAILLISKG